MKCWGLPLVLMLLINVMPATADPHLTATYRQIGPNYRMEFVLYMDEFRGAHGWGLYITNITDLEAPLGWEAGKDSRKTEWFDRLPIYDVPPSGILRGCAGTLQTLPSELGYFVRLTGPGIATYGGGVIPQPVPEPTALSALASLSLMAMVGLRRRLKVS